MKLTKLQLKQIIKEELSAVMEKADLTQYRKNKADAEKYKKKGKWILKDLGGSEYVTGGSVKTPEWGTKEEARVFTNELSADNYKDRLEKEGNPVTKEKKSDKAGEEK